MPWLEPRCWKGEERDRIHEGHDSTKDTKGDPKYTKKNHEDTKTRIKTLKSKKRGARIREGHEGRPEGHEENQFGISTKSTKGTKIFLIILLDFYLSPYTVISERLMEWIPATIAQG